MMKIFTSLKYPLLILFPITILIYNIQGILFNCYNVTDFSIYQQAIYEIANSFNFNPYLTVRDLNIFNDHFDPIILIAAPIARLFNYSPLSLIFTEWLFYFTLFLFLLTKKNESNKGQVDLALIGLIFSKGILSGLLFPIHPSTWSILPFFFISYYIYQHNVIGIIISSFLVCLFKESYPFAILSLSIFYALNRYFKLASILLTFSMLFILFDFKIRFLLLGTGMNYGGGFVQNLLASPIKTILDAIMNLSLNAPSKLLYPFILPIALVIYKEWRNVKEIKSSPLFAIILMIAPGFLLHILADRFYFQYAAQFVGPLIAILYCSKASFYLKENTKLFVATILLFAISGMGIYTKIFNQLVMGKNNKCTISYDKHDETTKVKNFIANNYSKERNIYATGGVVPNILKPGMKIYNKRWSAPQPFYNIVLIEKNGSGDIYPNTNDEVKNMILDCSRYSNEVILDSQYYYLATGLFPHNCVK